MVLGSNLMQVWLQIDTALSQGNDRRTSGANHNEFDKMEEGRAEELNRQRQAAEVSRAQSLGQPASHGTEGRGARLGPNVLCLT